MTDNKDSSAAGGLIPYPVGPAPTRRQMRLVDASAQIMQDAPDELGFTHVVLSQVGFPRSRPPADCRMFERTNGRVSMRIYAGPLWNERVGQWLEQPLPYGAITRLVMLYVQTEAVRQQSPIVELGRSMRDAMRQIGLADTGAANWRNFERQACALAACRLLLGYPDADGSSVTEKHEPIKRFTAWVHRDQSQMSLWPSTVELSTDFLETLLAHAVPLDLRAIGALSKSALALDIYTWLAHRLCRVRSNSGDRVSWQALKGQFGQEYIGRNAAKDFKKEFKRALHDVLTVYHSARIDTWGSGLVLLPSPPPVPRTRITVPLAYSRGA
jgi:hypothetical protein